MTSTQQRITADLLRASIGLAAQHFRTGDGPQFQTNRDDVLYVLDGHITAWTNWNNADLLSDEDALRFARLLLRRSNDFADARTAGLRLDTYLENGRIPGCSIDEDYRSNGLITVAAHMPLRAFVDDALDAIEVYHKTRTRVLAPAKRGFHTTSTKAGSFDGTSHQYVDFRFELQAHHESPSAVVPTVVTAPPLQRRFVPFHELRDVAERIDRCMVSRGRSGHRTDKVRDFEKALEPADGGLALTAGSVNELLAYTGFGKSVVLIEVFACWAAENNVSVGFVLPNNSDVVRFAFQIEQALACIGREDTVVPLTSPRSRFKVAEQAIKQSGGADDDWTRWVWERFGYGCALSASADTDEGVDTWTPGAEPCAKLRKPRPNGKLDTVACPWRATCGKFAAVRVACSANIIVTSHSNLLMGVLQTPVTDQQGPTDRMSVEELLLRRCQIIVADELDVLQQEAIGYAGRDLTLDQGGRTNTPLRNLDADFGAAFGQLGDDVDASVRDAFFGLRYLSENYVSHVSYRRIGAIAPSRKPEPRGSSRYWIVPRRWDHWLTCTLFGIDPTTATSSEDIAHQRLMFRSLFPGEVDQHTTVPPDFADARNRIEQILNSGSAGAALPKAREALTQLVSHASPADRAKFVNRVLRRALLERIRRYLTRLVVNNGQLVDVGVESAQAIADALGTYGRWQATPTGPLGRLVFAFKERYDDKGRNPTTLTTAAFGGDPHTHIVRLGDITALARAGVRRIVLGLSATSYFPGAPLHHVHTRPRWWVRDDNPGSVTITSTPVLDGNGNPLRISGKEGTSRANATRQIAMSLWRDELAAELARLEVEEPERRRILLAVTSYDAGRHVAEGLHQAGVAGERICLAVRPDRQPDTKGTAFWQEISATNLADFPTYEDAQILIAPLARVERGVNMIGDEDKSALGSIWLIVRPIPLTDEPEQLVAHVQAKALAEYPGPSTNPISLLKARATCAADLLEDIFRRPPYFGSQPDTVKLGVIAEIVISAIQLIGRARRGGTAARLHLVDGAFVDSTRGNDFAALLNKLQTHWSEEQRRDMHRYYGTTLDAFLDYARDNGASPC